MSHALQDRAPLLSIVHMSDAGSYMTTSDLLPAPSPLKEAIMRACFTAERDMSPTPHG